MISCTICRFAQELDDVAVAHADGLACICLNCYARETDTARPMPKALRRELIAVLVTVDVAD